MTADRLASILVASGAAVILTLGLAHLVLTFRGTKLHPRDPSLVELLRECPPNISRGTTMWRAWLGFNASHSLGAILFGLLYITLAVVHPPVLFASPILLGVGAAALVGYLILAVRYWFHAPLRGIALALALYLAGVVASAV